MATARSNRIGWWCEVIGAHAGMDGRASDAAGIPGDFDARILPSYGTYDWALQFHSGVIKDAFVQ